jgi:hypothetical protein
MEVASSGNSFSRSWWKFLNNESGAIVVSSWFFEGEQAYKKQQAVRRYSRFFIQV